VHPGNDLESISVTVRRATPQDATRVRALRLEMLTDTPLAFVERIDEAVARSHRQFRARFTDQSTGTASAQFIAEAGGRLVGHAGGMTVGQAPEVSLLYAVYITPEWRGRGLLRQLVDAVGGWSREAGRPRLELEVVTSNQRAITAYQRIGFVDTGRRSPHPTIPVLTELVMTRPA
jgi:GNAT superfamily N-acetyltransferase